MPEAAKNRLTDMVVQEVSLVDKAANRTTFAVRKSDGGDEDDKAWTSAYVNDLPDSAFLYVESGDKDEEHKTTPRSLRHFPVRDKGGKVDLPHVRNALSRIPQSALSQGIKDKAAAEARRMLAAAGGNPTEKKMTTKKAASVKMAALKALVAKLALKLPKDAKQSIMDGLAESLDKLTALATMVGDAEVDDSAQVPPELAAALEDAGEQIEAIAEQFGGGPESSPEGSATGGENNPPGQGANPNPAGQSEGAPFNPDAGMKRDVGKAVNVTKAELDAYTAGKVTLDAAQSKLWDACRLLTEDPPKAQQALKDAQTLISSASTMLGGGAPEQMAAAGKALAVAKDLPKEAHDGDGMGTELHDGDSLSQILRKSLACGHLTVAAVEKAGRKMAKDRYAKLAAMHDALGKLLNELAYDGAAEKVGAKLPEAKPGENMPPKPDKGAKRPDLPAGDAQQKLDAGGGTGDFAGKPPPEKAPKVEAAPTGKAEDVARLEKALADAQDAQVLLAKRFEELAKVAGGGPASGPVEKSGGDAAAAEVWPLDMSADIAERRAKQQKAKANGAAG